MTDLFIEGALWILVLSGGLAGLGLIAEGCERFADAMDAWIESISTHYLDDL